MNQFRDFSDLKMTEKTNINSSNDAQQFAPSFLFGGQQPVRRSFTAKNGEYGSPGILRKRELSSGTGKNVHWSPVLVRSRSKSPDARKLQRLSSGKSASTSLWNGPPLRSLNEEIVGPPSKLSRMEPSHSEQFSFQSNGGEQVEEMCEIDSEELAMAAMENFIGSLFLALHLIIGTTFWNYFLDMGISWHNGQRRMEIGYIFVIRHLFMLDRLSPKMQHFFHGQMIGVVPCRERDALTVQETTVPPKSRNSSNGSCSFLENDMSSLLHFNGGDTPTRLVPSTSFCKEDISVPSRARLSFSTRSGMRPLNSSLVSMNGSADSSLVKGKEDSFIGKLWNSIFSSGGDNSASTNTD
uniref:Uncharacterized protein n=1 Tax=Meloidogyne enterolobii TaxID=390850 RepID=A0A6V7YBS2_MELEN|nr:unnamed protein product [Meloidogyne enterolobii]